MMKFNHLFSNLTFYPFYVLLFLLFTNCKKKITEQRVVVSLEKRRVPTFGDVLHFDMINENMLYAACHQNSNDEVTIFFSDNGGISWTQKTSPVQSGEDIFSMAFLDKDNGAVIIDRTMYATDNGGGSWTELTTSFGLSIPAFFVKKNGDSSYIVFENAYQLNEDILEVQKGSLNISLLGTYTGNFYYYDFGVCENDKLFFFDYDINLNDGMKGYDTSDFVWPLYYGFSTYEKPTSIAYGNGEYIILHKGGWIRNLKKWGLTYNEHDKDYYDCVYMKNYFVAVGEEVISTDFFGEWKDAVNDSHQSFKETFRKIKNIDGKHFYVSGDNGVFYRARVE